MTYIYEAIINYLNYRLSVSLPMPLGHLFDSFLWQCTPFFIKWKKNYISLSKGRNKGS
jgi:hypothetical protein